MAAADENLTDLPMSNLVEQVLPFRSSKYIKDLCEKMLGEGIATPADLLRVSKEALETKLATHAAFEYIEMADAISLYSAIDRNAQKEASKSRSRSPQRRARSRSHDNFRERGNRNSSGDRTPPRKNSHTNQSHYYRRPPRNPRKRKNKPELWAAVERNDEAKVEELLSLGTDAEEKFEGWSPLMKAAEEGGVEVMKMLLDKKVDIEAANKKGRTALSFAAAPSNDERTGRPRATPVAALRLLLERGADANRRDARDKTPKDYASREKRDEALAIFHEFGY